MSGEKIISEKNVFEDKLIIREGEIKYRDHAYKRLGLDRVDAAAVFILNTDHNTVVLTRQFRYPVTFKSVAPLLEIVAGKLDDGEQPFTAAMRETLEETGYQIQEGNIRLLLNCFSTPGYSSERFYIFYATVCNADRTEEGGGKADENENIEVIEMPRPVFDSLIKDGNIFDAKTYIAGQHLLLHKI